MSQELNVLEGLLEKIAARRVPAPEPLEAMLARVGSTVTLGTPKAGDHAADKAAADKAAADKAAADKAAADKAAADKAAADKAAADKAAEESADVPLELEEPIPLVSPRSNAARPAPGLAAIAQQDAVGPAVVHPYRDLPPSEPVARFVGSVAVASPKFGMLIDRTLALRPRE